MKAVYKIEHEKLPLDENFLRSVICGLDVEIRLVLAKISSTNNTYTPSFHVAAFYADAKCTMKSSNIYAPCHWQFIPIHTDPLNQLS